VPIVGTGAGGLGTDDAAGILCQVLTTHLGRAEFPSEVSIVVEREDEKKMVDALLQKRGAQ
jgi:O-acetyl-ADP-ribose deacetylase (regulator of RNase III)